MVVSGDFMLRKAFLQDLCGPCDDILLRADQKDAVSMARSAKEMRHEIGAVQILYKRFAEFDAAGDVNAKPVIQHPEIAERCQKGRVTRRKINRMGVGEGDVDALSRIQGVING